MGHLPRGPSTCGPPGRCSSLASGAETAGCRPKQRRNPRRRWLSLSQGKQCRVPQRSDRRDMVALVDPILQRLRRRDIQRHHHLAVRTPAPHREAIVAVVFLLRALRPSLRLRSQPSSRNARSASGGLCVPGGVPVGGDELDRPLLELVVGVRIDDRNGPDTVGAQHALPRQ
jgi:hypothetical protein